MNDRGDGVKKRTPYAVPRLRRSDRARVLMQPVCLEEMLPTDHPVRTIWAMVEM